MTKHLSVENREVIEFGIGAGDSAGRIARRIGVSTSTVTREVKSNRTVREKKHPGKNKPSIRCVSYDDCQRSGSACPKCSTRLTTCKHYRTRSCVGSCPDFRRKMCPDTQKRPYVCPNGCAKRSWCGFPKCGYSAKEADANYRTRLSSSREGIDMDGEQLAALDAAIRPLVKQGHSFEAICSSHDGVGVCARTLYNYQEKGLSDDCEHRAAAQGAPEAPQEETRLRPRARGPHGAHL